MTPSRRRFLRSAVAAGAALSFPARGLHARSVRVQGDDDRMPPGFDRPDDRGEFWAQVEHDGVTAYCPIPVEMRKKNEGGTDGAGLCVIASQVTDSNWQQIGEVGATLWKTAKQRRGGYWPERLKELMAELAPEIPYQSYEGRDTTWMEHQLQSGIPIGVTYGTGRGYEYQQIAHMVSLVHLDSEWGAVVDNNFPGFVAWMPRAEFDRRFVLGIGEGWAFYFDIPAPQPDQPFIPSSSGGIVLPMLAATAAGGLACLTLATATAIGVGGGLLLRRRLSQEPGA